MYQLCGTKKTKKEKDRRRWRRKRRKEEIIRLLLLLMMMKRGNRISRKRLQYCSAKFLQHFIATFCKFILVGR